MNLEDSIVEVDRLLSIGKIHQLHFEIAIFDIRPAILISAIILGLDAGSSENDWVSFEAMNGDGYGGGVGYGAGAGNGVGYGYGAGNGYEYWDEDM